MFSRYALLDVVFIEQSPSKQLETSNSMGTKVAEVGSA